MAKQDELEAEIEAELKRQEELLKQIDRDEKLREAEQAQATGENAGAASVDPRERPAGARSSAIFPLRSSRRSRARSRKANGATRTRSRSWRARSTPTATAPPRRSATTTRRPA